MTRTVSDRRLEDARFRADCRAHYEVPERHYGMQIRPVQRFAEVLCRDQTPGDPQADHGDR